MKQVFKFGGIKAGIKTNGLNDVGIIYSDKPLVAAAMFTKNQVCAAPVKISKEHLKSKEHRAVIVNSGNANACTGEEGFKNAKEMCRLVAEELNCSIEDVLVCSTGIIGKQLPMEKISRGIHEAVQNAKNENDPIQFSDSILTTDLVRKGVEIALEGGGSIIGYAKGSGMIHPNMATMLAFLVTDVSLPKNELQKSLQFAVDRSFNALTVDGDTSTNDTVILLSPASDTNECEVDLKAFQDGLVEACVSLAKSIARDGEGAEHLVTIDVVNGNSFEEAKQVAKTIAKSPLVKTAIAGNDPNWGRILCAVGYSGVNVSEERVKIFIENVCVYDEKPISYDKKELSGKMAQPEITIKVDLSVGRFDAQYYTCDLTHGYITINAEYHT